MKVENFSVDTESAGTLTGLRWGSTHDLPVLALHGWLDNAASFAPLAACLGGVQIFAIDLPGHGKSDHRPPGTRYHLMDYVPAVLEVADALGFNRILIMGHSLGAAIAGLAAVAAPERVRAVILIEGLGPVSEPESKLPGRLRDSVAGYARVLKRAAPVYPDIETLVSSRARISAMSEASARLLIERNVNHHDDGYRWCSDSRLRLDSPAFLTEPQVLACLKAIAQPIQVLLGNDGMLTKRETLSPRLEALSSADVRWFDGAHHLHMDHPEVIAAAAADFLSQFVP